MLKMKTTFLAKLKFLKDLGKKCELLIRTELFINEHID